MGDAFAVDCTSPIPPAAKRRTKTAAQRREQTKRSAARLAAALVAPVEPVEPLVPHLHAAGTTSPLSTSSSTAALAAVAAAPSPMCPVALALPLARDVSCLLTSPACSPWRSLRARKRRRAHRPHRHERVARAEAAALHQGIRVHRAQVVHDVVERLRNACYEALGPLYTDLELQGPCSPGAVTPLPSARILPQYALPPGRLLVHARDDLDACWAEIVHLAAIGGEAQEPDNPRAAQEAVDAFCRLEDFWRDEFIAAHTALIADADAFDAQQLNAFKLRYVLGLANWFLDFGD